MRHFATVAVCAVAVSMLAAPAAFADGTNTLYVSTGSDCTDSGTGTQAAPFCTIQAAADAANPGDVVLIEQGTYPQTVDITRSGTANDPITFTGVAATSQLTSPVSRILGSASTSIQTPITVLGASNIVIEDLSAGDSTSDGIVVDGGSDIAITGVWTYLTGTSGNTTAGVRVTGGASAVTVERSHILGSDGPGLEIDGGSAGTVAADDLFVSERGSAVEVDGATGTDVVSDSADIVCGPAVGVQDSSTGTVVENDVFQSVNRTNLSTCAADANAVDIQADSSSAPTMTSDYNVVYPDVYGPDAYEWSGSVYTTPAAFSAATGQGSHDVQVSLIGFAPTEGSPLIDSANSAAPGELSTDLYGNPRVDDPTVANTGAGPSGDDDRGAVEFQDPVTTTAYPTLPYTVAPVGATITASDAAATDSWGAPLTCYLLFGDGTTAQAAPGCTASHAYQTAGTYDIYEYGVSTSGQETAERYVPLTVAAPTAFAPALEAEANGPLGVEADATQSKDDWNITGYTYDFGDGTAPVIGTAAAEHTYAKPGTYTITVTETDAGGNTQITTAKYTTTATQFTPITPTRLLDTRHGTGAEHAKVAAGGTVVLTVTGKDGIPAGAAAVAVNLTVTDTSGSGFVTAYADGTPGGAPSVSNLNYTAGATVANEAIVPLGADGEIDLYNGGSGAGPIDMIADVTGYFDASGADGYTALEPVRILDTRAGTGVAKAKVGADRAITLTVAGADGGALPASGISAVALHVTETDASGTGFVTAYAQGSSVPSASNLDYAAGHTVSNTVIVPVSASGKIELYNGGASAGTVDLIADVDGYYSVDGDGAYVPVDPLRLADTRETGALDFNGGFTVTPSTFYGTFPGTPTAFVLNLTATEPTGTGYLEASPNDEVIPGVSSVNYVPGQTVANLAQVAAGAWQAVIITNNGTGARDVDVLVDMSGYYIED